MEPITPTELLSLPRSELISRCKKWMKEFNDGNLMRVAKPMDCPLALWVVYNDTKCAKELVAYTTKCPLCGNPMCPDCMNHNVEILSRVTGYMSGVSGWGAAKKQEFEDRHRYDGDLMR